MSHASTVIDLGDAAACDERRVGSKAAALARMLAAGLPVPPGFVVTTDAFDTAFAPVAAEVRAALEGLPDDDVEALGRASEAARAAIGRAPLDEALASELARALDALDLGGGYSVRSSATAEDLPDASFAGQYDSLLNVRPQGLAEAVRQVWASLYTARAVDYRRRRGIPHEHVRMAVLVQPLVGASAAGVVFTRDPMTGDAGRMVVNVARGLGEGVVAGSVAADTFVLDAGTFEVVERDVREKRARIVASPEGGVREEVVASEHAAAPALDDERLLAIGRLAAWVRDCFRDDRDIEFAVDGAGTVHILQARPITALPASPRAAAGGEAAAFDVEWDDPADAAKHWVLAVPGAGPLVRLEQDIALARQRHAEVLLRDIGPAMDFARYQDLRIVNGYAYGQLHEVPRREAARRLHDHRSAARAYLERGTTYYDAEIEPPTRALLARLEPGRRRRLPLAARYEHLAEAVEANGRVFGDLHWRMAAGGAEGDPKAETLATVYVEVTGRPAAEAAALVVGADHATARLVRRLQGLARVAHEDPALRAAVEAADAAALRRPPLHGRPATQRFRRRLRSLLRVYGRRTGDGYGSASRPMDPTWNMDPRLALLAVGAYLRTDLDEMRRRVATVRRQRRAEVRRVRRLAERDPDLARRFEVALFGATEGVRVMEDHNFLMEQCIAGTLREAIDALGRDLVRLGRLDEARHVSHCSMAELEAVCMRDDALDLRALVAERRAEWRRWRALTPPAKLGSGSPPADAGLPPMWDRASADAGLDGRVLRGTPASVGVAEGRARVVTEPTIEPPRVERGDILVAANAGPDWTPVFPLLGGLVLDGGEAFQHASLVAREYGVPAVIQTREGTRVIRDGQRLHIDGARGVVELEPALTSEAVSR